MTKVTFTLKAAVGDEVGHTSSVRKVSFTLPVGRIQLATSRPNSICDRSIHGDMVRP